jgi:hypothetical protein
MRISPIVTSFFIAAAAPISGAALADDLPRLKKAEGIIAFTSGPSDLGTVSSFLRKFPPARCAAKLMQESPQQPDDPDDPMDDYLVYLCSNGSKPAQEFRFKFAYSETSAVLVAVSLNGEKPNLGQSLQRLTKLLD